MISSRFDPSLEDVVVPKPYPIELRERVVEAITQDGLTIEEAAARFKVGTASVKRWRRRHRRGKGLAPDPMGGVRVTNWNDQRRKVLRAIVEATPDATLDEIQEQLADEHNIEASTSSISRALAALGLTRKKKTVRAKQRDRDDVVERRSEFMALMPSLDSQRLVFIDEAGINLLMRRTYARSQVNTRAECKEDVGYAKNITMIGALTLDGLEALFTIEGACDGQVFMVYIEKVLSEILRDGDIVVMDNVKFHLSERVASLIESLGASVLYLPPYSPELNPIEECWSKVKTHLRKVAARTEEALHQALSKAEDLVLQDDARGWFTHAGYLVST